MIKIIFICDNCGTQKTSKDLPEGWFRGQNDNDYKNHYCSKDCRPRKKKVKYVPYVNDDPGVGALYGRT